MGPTAKLENLMWILGKPKKKYLEGSEKRHLEEHEKLEDYHFMESDAKKILEEVKTRRVEAQEELKKVLLEQKRLWKKNEKKRKDRFLKNEN